MLESFTDTAFMSDSILHHIGTMVEMAFNTRSTCANSNRLRGMIWMDPCFWPKLTGPKHDEVNHQRVRNWTDAKKFANSSLAGVTDLSELEFIVVPIFVPIAEGSKFRKIGAVEINFGRNRITYMYGAIGSRVVRESITQWLTDDWIHKTRTFKVVDLMEATDLDMSPHLSATDFGLYLSATLAEYIRSVTCPLVADCLRVCVYCSIVNNRLMF